MAATKVSRALASFFCKSRSKVRTSSRASAASRWNRSARTPWRSSFIWFFGSKRNDARASSICRMRLATLLTSFVTPTRSSSVSRAHAPSYFEALSTSLDEQSSRLTSEIASTLIAGLVVSCCFSSSSSGSSAASASSTTVTSPSYSSSSSCLATTATGCAVWSGSVTSVPTSVPTSATSLPRAALSSRKPPRSFFRSSPVARSVTSSSSMASTVAPSSSLSRIAFATAVGRARASASCATSSAVSVTKELDTAAPIQEKKARRIGSRRKK
mmetsp:Transcript_26475/g.85598  ORF Transcript_26475/g.85598 Transcript_26475/m.85598 type:complete len:271 (-) Transcript_26475:729-1541(-)